MKLIGSFCLRTIADEIVAIPTGESVETFSGIISLNGVGRFLMELLAQECTEQSLTDRLQQEYEVDGETAAADVRDFLQILRTNGLLRE